MPRHLSHGLGGFLLALLTDTEPEGRRITSFFAPLVWITIPLASICLCVLSWVTYVASSKSTRPVSNLVQLGSTLIFAASFVPAILVVRELLIYRIFGVDLPTVVDGITNFVRVLKVFMNPALLFGRRGVWVIPVVIFAETGLFFGFFLPGDSLLLTVGVVAYLGRLNLALVIPLSILAAILGDQLGYTIGRQSGEALAYRYRFVRDNLQRANEFYSKHGGKSIILARFPPVVRTFAPIVAGAARMQYFRFTISNIAGGALWVLSVTLAGYFAKRFSETYVI